jgi:putative heme-binding domain-containing protein
MSRTQNVKPPAHSERLDALIVSPSEPVRAAALQLAGAWKRIALRPQLLEALQSPQSSDSIRTAAASGLALLGDRDTAGELRKLASAGGDARVRRAALVSLTQIDLHGAVVGATALFGAGDADPGPVLAAFMSRDGGADALAANLKGKPISPDTAKLALRYLRGASTQNASLTEIFSAAAGMSGAAIRLSPDQMKQTIEEVATKGNAANGERVFRRAEASCYLCHAIDGAGGWLAPDLSSIGASSPIDYLINAVLDPNKDIKDGYDGLTVVTKSGDVFSGIKVSQDNARLVLRDNAHQELPIPLSDIKAQKSIGSLMPNGLTDTLTHQEFIDLVRFLSELGKPGPYASTPAQYIRRWRVIDPLPPDLASAQPSQAAIASLDGKNWAPAYSLVSGILPADSIAATGQPVGYVRGEVNVTAAGKFRLVLNDDKAVSLWVDDKPQSLSDDTMLELPLGVHSLTFRVDFSQRGNQGLRVEIADAPGSTGHAQPVGGK